MEKKHKFLIIGLSTLSALFLSAIVFVTYQYYKDFNLFNPTEDNSFDRYVSEEETTDGTDLAENIVTDNTSEENINEGKQGELTEDENRQILNVSKDLTEEEEK